MAGEVGADGGLGAAEPLAAPGWGEALALGKAPPGAVSCTNG